MRCKVLTMSQRRGCLLILPRESPEEESFKLLGPDIGDVQVVCFTNLSRHPGDLGRWMQECIRERGYCLLRMDSRGEEAPERAEGPPDDEIIRHIGPRL